MKVVAQHLRLAVEIALLCIAIFIWRDERAGREKAMQQVADNQAQIEAARRDSAQVAEQLQHQLAALQAEKKTPANAQNLGAVFQALNVKLPVPLETESAGAGVLTPQTTGSVANVDAPQAIVIPAADASVVRNELLTCQQTQDRLGACAKTSSDLGLELASTERQRDAWHRAANGGSWLHRAVRAVEYVGIGVGVGYAIAKR